MKPLSNQKNNKFSRESIIGLGEDSFRKNYYPELQDKLLDLERSNTRNRALITAIPDIILVSDMEGHILPFSIRDEKKNRVITSILSHHSVYELLRSEVLNVVEKRELSTCQFSIIENQVTLHFEARIHISEFNEILIIIRDVTEQVLLEEQLRQAAEIDGLTGLFNRLSFENRLSRYDKRRARSFSVLLLDIDGLKIINDTLGHLSGDLLIKSMANIIKTHFNHIGFTARIGGDEFGVIISNCDAETIELSLMELTASVQKHNDMSDTLKITMSYGYSHIDDGIVDKDFMYQEADNNMYQNKLLKTSSTRHNTVKTLMKALEVRDYITEGHADRMGYLGRKMGLELKLSQSFIDRIELLTKFHDIGKVGISDTILNKPSRLNDKEYAIMKTHCAIGERIANESSELKDIAHLILKHHEKWDGTGYPLGLEGEAIPLECRILSLVDTYDAMTNDRPYRKAMSHEEAIDEIVRCSGTQFDPDLAELFIGLNFEESALS